MRLTLKLADFTISIPSILGQQGECQFPRLDKLLILVALNRSRLDFSPRLEGFSSVGPDTSVSLGEPHTLTFHFHALLKIPQSGFA